MGEQQVNEYLKGAVEALLFISDKLVEIDQIKEVLETVEASEIRQLIKTLQKDYEENDRGMMIREIAGGYQMLSNPQYAEFVRNFFKTRVKEKLSRPALEALSIAAYRQPVSRADVELIRGVNSDGVVTHLLEKGLVKIVGRKDVPGRPFLYGTTKMFLEYFGLKSLKDLPKLEDVTELLGAQGEESSGADLFSSNHSVSVEESVTDFGGEDHLNQSFAREGITEAFEEEIEEEIEEGQAAEEQVAEQAVEEDQDAEQAAEEDQDAEQAAESGEVCETETSEDLSAEPLEEAEDLKKVMDEMGRDHPAEELPAETVEVSSAQDEKM